MDIIAYSNNIQRIWRTIPIFGTSVVFSEGEKQRTLAQMFSCEFCEISKNAFFTEHLWWLLLTVGGSKEKRMHYRVADTLEFWVFEGFEYIGGLNLLQLNKVLNKLSILNI